MSTLGLKSLCLSLSRCFFPFNNNLHLLSVYQNLGLILEMENKVYISIFILYTIISTGLSIGKKYHEHMLVNISRAESLSNVLNRANEPPSIFEWQFQDIKFYESLVRACLKKNFEKYTSNNTILKYCPNNANGDNFQHASYRDIRQLLDTLVQFKRVNDRGDIRMPTMGDADTQLIVEQNLRQEDNTNNHLLKRNIRAILNLHSNLNPSSAPETTKRKKPPQNLYELVVSNHAITVMFYR